MQRTLRKMHDREITRFMVVIGSRHRNTGWKAKAFRRCFVQRLGRMAIAQRREKGGIQANEFERGLAQGLAVGIVAAALQRLTSILPPYTGQLMKDQLPRPYIPVLFFEERRILFLQPLDTPEADPGLVSFGKRAPEFGREFILQLGHERKTAKVVPEIHGRERAAGVAFHNQRASPLGRKPQPRHFGPAGSGLLPQGGKHGFQRVQDIARDLLTTAFRIGLNRKAHRGFSQTISIGWIIGCGFEPRRSQINSN